MSASDVTQPSPLQTRRFRRLRPPRRAGWIAVALAFTLAALMTALLVGLIGYQLHYRDRVYRGVRVWELEVGGLRRDQAQQALERYLDPWRVSWVLRDGEQTWTVTPDLLGVRLDAWATAEAAFAIGRSGSAAWNLGEQLRVAVSGAQVPPVIIYDEPTTRRYLEELADEIYRPVQDAELTRHGLSFFETRPQVGRQLNVEATLSALQQSIGRLGPQEINLVVQETAPRVIDASIAHDRAVWLTSQPLTLYVESASLTFTLSPSEPVPGPWVLSREALADMLLIREVPVGDGTSYRLDALLDPAALAETLAPLGQEISRTPVNARFIFNDLTRQLEVIAPSVDGLELDVDQSLERITAYLERGERQVPLAVQVVPAEFNEHTTAEALGITELIAAHKTFFAGSSAGRRNNVEVAASKFHGIIIKPGETFSFNAWLGEVSEEEGYDESLIIFGNETIPDVGGGICQVSTTAFGAAFWAGYPIVERWAHAYRVGYYEQGGRPVGMDATIYSPHVDFKFLNDTPYHLLIETYVNQQASTLEFKFYSTNSGRIVEMEGPVITDVIEHGEPVYKEDPLLAPGEIKQVEWATDGMTTVITRTVRDAATGAIIEKRAFKSKFRPWNAVYLVGPGTEVPGHDVIRLDE